jgi:hypothetical protein
MGFWSEIKQAIKEGWEEGKEEAKEEGEAESKAVEAKFAAKEAQAQGEKEAAKQAAQSEIERVPYEEKFGMCLAAPFRITVFYDWYTIWKDDDEDDLLYPLHLYTFGSGVDIKPEDVKNLKKNIKASFGIKDRKTAIVSIRGLLAAIGVSAGDSQVFHATDAEECEESALEGLLNNPDLDPESTFCIRILLCSMIAFAVTSAADAGYLEKGEVIEALASVNRYVRDLLPREDDNWEVFAKAFLFGEEEAGLNNDKGRKLLHKFVSYLQGKEGSPWNNVPFRPARPSVL